MAMFVFGHHPPSHHLDSANRRADSDLRIEVPFEREPLVTGAKTFGVLISTPNSESLMQIAPQILNNHFMSRRLQGL